MRDAVPFEYQSRHAPCLYAGHTFYLVNYFLPKEVTTPPTSHHDLPELLHDASLVLESLHGTASHHLNAKHPFTMRPGGSGCAGVRCSIIASIFADTLFRPPLLFIPPPFVPMRMLLLVVPLVVPLLPFSRERDATESETTQQHRPARSAKLRTTARCPRTKTILTEGASRL